MSSGYTNPGPYTQGVWLIAKGGDGAVVDRSHLPAAGQGFQYYWLGTSSQEAQARLIDALSKLNVHTDIVGQDLANPVNAGLAGHVGLFTKAPTGIMAWIKSLSQGVAFWVPGAAAAALTDAAGVEGGAAAGAGAGAGAAGAGAAGANALKAAVGALTLTSLFTQTGLWAGIGMSILGAVLILFGIIKLSGRDPTAMAKRVIP